MQRKILIAGMIGLLLAGAASVLTLRPQAAQADSHKYQRPRHLQVPADAPQVWRDECGSCHMLYAPALLPAAAWQQQMQQLAEHYGSDASLAAADNAAILVFLQKAASGNRLPVEASSDGMPPRISTTRWFQRKHHEVSKAKFARPSVSGPANCVACHRNAEEGRFGKVKIPKA